MKKLFSMAALALVGAGMTFTACSSDNIAGVEAPNTEQAQDNDQVLRLAVACNSENLDTRTTTAGTAAQRSLWSSEAKQSINYVKIVILKLDPQFSIPTGEDAKDITKYSILRGANAKVAVHTFNNWMAQSAVGPNTGERESLWKLATDEKLEDGKYIAYAVGYNKEVSATSEPEYTGLYNFENIENVTRSSQVTVMHSATTGVITVGDATLPLEVTQYSDDTQEIFAGMTNFEVTTKKTGNSSSSVFNATLRLHRMVAGQLSYVTKIPVHGDAERELTLTVGGKSTTVNCGSIAATKLRLVAKHRYTKLGFNNFNSAFVAEDNTTGATDNRMYIVNGNTDATADTKYGATTGSTNDAYVIWTEELKNWFGTGTMDTNGDNILDNNDTGWTNHIDATNKNPLIKKGSVLAGKFLIPFGVAEDDVTFELQELGDYDANNKDLIIRTWKINIPDADKQYGKYLSGTSGATNAGQTYNIYRNHLYSIGKRTADNDKDNTPDPDPDDDDDQPENLLKQSLNLIVNAVWENVHGMEVE